MRPASGGMGQVSESATRIMIAVAEIATTTQPIARGGDGHRVQRMTNVRAERSWISQGNRWLRGVSDWVPPPCEPFAA